MFHRKLLEQQISYAGVRLGDSCSIHPFSGKRKAFTLNRHRIDFVSSHFRPSDLSMSYIELPHQNLDQFHYRLELEDPSKKEGRFILKTLKGRAYWLNGLAAKEAYVERLDRIYIDDNRINFGPNGLEELTKNHFERPVLKEQKLLESDLKILIQGETGTGKTHLAQKIHERSLRSGLFVSINLSSYNPQLIESELFGHKRGSFTGALNDKEGAFSMAERGTLFLDEIDSLPIEIQTKLLTFIDSKKYRRVGDVKENDIHTRLIFASGRPLEGLVQQGLFRKDFYYRLKAGHTVELISLRNDVTRIKEACQYFCLNHSVSMSQRLSDFYETLAWPGNIRQLFGHLEKKRILSKSLKLDSDHMDEELLLQSSDLMSFESNQDLISMDQFKTNYVKRAMSICEGNVSMTARKLRLTEKTVRSLLQKI